MNNLLSEIKKRNEQKNGILLISKRLVEKIANKHCGDSSLYFNHIMHIARVEGKFSHQSRCRRYEETFTPFSKWLEPLLFSTRAIIRFYCIRNQNEMYTIILTNLKKKEEKKTGGYSFYWNLNKIKQRNRDVLDLSHHTEQFNHLIHIYYVQPHKSYVVVATY